MSLERTQEQIEVQNAPNSPTPSIHRFRNRATSVLGAGVLATTMACGSEVSEPHPGEGGSAIVPAYFDCEASGSDSPTLMSEWGLTPMYTSDTLEAATDSNADSHTIDLNHAGAAPLDQSSYYKCTFKGGQNCTFTVNPAPSTKYEAAQMESSHFIRWYTWPEDGETTSRTSDHPLSQGDVALVQVVSDPEGNGSYPVQISLNPECE